MDVGGKAMMGLRWLGGAKLAGQVFSWVMTIVVIRLLTPADYGLMAIAVLFVHFLMLLNEMGLSSVLIQKAKLDDDVVRQIFALIIIVNVTFFLLLFVSAPLIAGFFDEERLTPMIRVLAVLFLISIFEIIPVALLERDLDFKMKSLVFLGSSVGGGLITLTLAFTGFGVWSLIGGNLASTILKTVGINMVSPYYHWPKY